MFTYESQGEQQHLLAAKVGGYRSYDRLKDGRGEETESLVSLDFQHATECLL